MSEPYKRLLVRGAGSRTDPRRYHGIGRRHGDIHPGSQDHPGTNGHAETQEVLATDNPAVDELWKDVS